jgi:hypothetical protein
LDFLFKAWFNLEDVTYQLYLEHNIHALTTASDLSHS